MWLKKLLQYFSCLVFLFKSVYHRLCRDSTLLPLFVFFLFSCWNLLLCTWLSFALHSCDVFTVFSSTNLCRLIAPGQTSERRPRGTTRRADPRAEREHPTHHTPDRGLGAPQRVRRQGRLSQQPGPVCLVPLGWSAHQRRRWVFRLRACLFWLSVGWLPLKSVTFTVIWLLVLSPGFLPILCWQ